MKKLLIAAIALLGLAAKSQAAPLYGYVQITTTTALTPTLQNGSIRIASGTVQNLNVTYGVSAATGTFSGAVTAGSFSGPGSGLTGVILNQSSLQSGATFFVSSGTVNTQLNLNGALALTGSSGSSGQSLQSNGASAPTWVNVPSAILSTTSTWTANQTISSATVTTLNSTTIVVTTITPTGIIGTTTNNSANIGNYGEYKSSATTNTNAVNAPSTNTYGDLVNLSLTAGDWDVTAVLGCTLNGATQTELSGGISTTSGNSSTGLSFGDTLVETTVPTSPNDSTVIVPNVRMSLSGTTTVYLKMHAIYSAGTPKFYGRLSARRMR